MLGIFTGLPREMERPGANKHAATTGKTARALGLTSQQPP